MIVALTIYRSADLKICVPIFIRPLQRLSAGPVRRLRTPRFKPLHDETPASLPTDLVERFGARLLTTPERRRPYEVPERGAPGHSADRPW